MFWECNFWVLNMLLLLQMCLKMKGKNDVRLVARVARDSQHHFIYLYSNENAVWRGRLSKGMERGEAFRVQGRSRYSATRLHDDR